MYNGLPNTFKFSALPVKSVSANQYCHLIIHSFHFVCEFQKIFYYRDVNQGWEAWPHAHLNKKFKSINICETSQNVFVALANIDMFQMILKSLFTVDF